MKVGKQFIQIPSDLLNSPAFMVLNIHERRCLDRIEIEHSRHAGRDNGQLPVTHRDLERHRVHARHVAVSLRVIEGLRLVECTERGRAGNREFRRPTLWRLTYLPTTGGKLANGQTKWIDPTHEWAKVETREEAQAIAKKLRVPDLRQRRAPRRKPRLRVVRSGQPTWVTPIEDEVITK